VKFIITAGGQGTKMWPLSRNQKPKQFQPIIGDRTLYQLTIESLLSGFAAEDIFISTKHKFIGLASQQAPQIPLKNFIIEPDIALDRGPGEGLAFLRLSLSCPDEPFMIVQSDVLHRPVDKFIKMIKDAEKLERRQKKLLTGGIKATAASVGVDYLQLGAAVDGADDAYEVAKFVPRKKTLKETRDLLNNFHIVTHSNHTTWYPNLMLEAYRKYRPHWYEALMKIKDAIGRPGETAAVEKIYASMKKGATEEVTTPIFDAGQGLVLLLPYQWTDLGTWNSVYDLMADEGENYADGKNVVCLDSSGSLVKANDGKLTALIGARDLIVVDTPDALLVAHKDDVDQIKTLQKYLAEHNLNEFL
jgi:mannose-1-phosphate guanylyltransferase